MKEPGLSSLCEAVSIKRDILLPWYHIRYKEEEPIHHNIAQRFLTFIYKFSSNFSPGFIFLFSDKYMSLT